jgi:hypothetical protein
MKNRPNLPRRRLKRKKPNHVRGFNDDEDDYRTEFAELCPGDKDGPPLGNS